MSRLLVAQRALTVPGWAKDALWRRAQAIPSLDLRFADNKSLVDATTGANLVDFTRASSGTYVDSEGVIRTATTNLLLQSEDFSTTWTNIESSENINVAVAPNGTTTADALVDTVNNSAHSISQNVAGCAGSTSYTFSCYMKKGSKDFGALILSPNASWGTGGGAAVFYDLTNGTITSITSATGTIQALPNGWYRCTATATTVASPGTVILRVCSSLTGSTQTYQGNGDEAIYIWGAQLEQSTTVGEYIPTTAATATRTADVASISGSNFSSWYRQDEGTVFVDFNGTNITSGQFPRILEFNDGTSNNLIRVQQYGANTVRASAVTATVTQFAADNGSVAVGVRGKTAFGSALNDAALVTNGASPTTDATYLVPTGLTQIGIGGPPGAPTSLLNSTIRRLTYWPVRLGNNVLQAITQ